MSNPIVECKLAAHEAQGRVGGYLDPILVSRNTVVIDNRATGERARNYRKARFVTLRGAAKAMGVSAPFLSDLERGNRNWNDENARRFIGAICKCQIQRLEDARLTPDNCPSARIA